MAMVQVQSYNFATVENPLSDGGNFAIVSDTNFTSSLRAIAGNLCEPTTVGAIGGAFWSGSVPAPSNAWPADQYAEITLTKWATASDFAYLMVRQGAFNSGTQYLVHVGFGLSGGSTGNCEIFAVVSNVLHVLQNNTGVTTAQNDVWRLSVVGNVLTVFRNGSQVFTFTDTNNYVTSGSPGFGLNAASAITNAQTNLVAFGANQAATPIFSLVGSTLTISSSTSGGTIYYTTDGSTPTHASSSISNGGSIAYSAGQTVKALESASNFVDSSVGIFAQLATSTFSPPVGNYSQAQIVTVSNADSAFTGFAQYYTLDGSTPTTGSTAVTGAIVVPATSTLKVLAVATGYINSTASATYTLANSTLVLTPLATDNFHRANASTLGPNWSTDTGGAPSLTIVSNQCLTDVSDLFGINYYSAVVAPANQYGAITVSQLIDSVAKIFLQIRGTLDFQTGYTLQVIGPVSSIAAAKVLLQTIVNGSPVATLFNKFMTVNPGDTFDLVAINTKIYLVYNNVLLYQGTDSNIGSGVVFIGEQADTLQTDVIISNFAMGGASTSGGTAVGWSPVDSRQAVPGFGPAANAGIVDEQGNVIYSAQDPPFSGNSQVSDNPAIPPTDSRISKPVDSRTSVPTNSRVAPPFGEAGEP